MDDPRNARGRRTRAALLAAMRELLEEQGFEAVTMAAVAERAGVTRRAVYLHFATRTELVTALYDYVGETDGLAHSLKPVYDAPDPVAALAAWAKHLADYHRKVLAVDRAVERVWREDEDAALHRKRVVGAQLGICRLITTQLHEASLLAEPWTVDTATDMLWAQISSDLIEGLLVDRHWSVQQLGDHLAAMYVATFVQP